MYFLKAIIPLHYIQISYTYCKHNFLCTGKSKHSCDLFYYNILFVAGKKHWSGKEMALSPRFAYSLHAVEPLKIPFPFM
jgi:hypothetical protein